MSQPRDVLTHILCKGAQDLLAKAIGDEVAMYLAERADLVDGQGHQLVVRNGFLPHRKIMTGIGAVEVQQPRVRDRRPVHEREKFTSSILLFGGTVEFDQDVTNEAGGEIAGRGAVIASGGLTSRPFFTEKARFLGEAFLPRIALGIAPLEQ